MPQPLIALAPAGTGAALSCALVTGRSGEWLLLGPPAPVARARRAESCLLDPERGDMVLLCHGQPGSAYIIAVLSRPRAADATLTVPARTTLRAAGGELRIEAARIGIDAAEALDLSSPELRASALRGDLSFERLHTCVAEVEARFGVVSTLARRISTTALRMVNKARDSFRWIGGVDETRAGRMRLRVDARLHVEAEHAELKARGRVHIDGEHIDLG